MQAQRNSQMLRMHRMWRLSSNHFVLIIRNEAQCRKIMISGHSRHRSKVDALHQIHSLHVHAPGTTFKTKRKIYTVNVYTTQLHVKRQIHLHNIAIMAPGRYCPQIICQILPFCAIFNKHSKMAPTHLGTGTARWTPRSPAVLIVGLQGFDDFVGSVLKSPKLTASCPRKRLHLFAWHVRLKFAGTNDTMIKWKPLLHVHGLHVAAPGPTFKTVQFKQ